MTDEITEIIQLLDKQNSQMFPYEPLEKMLGETNKSQAALILGVSVDMLKRFSQKGLSVDEADALACKIGVHPSSIWPEWLRIQPIDDFLLDMYEKHIHGKKRCFECKLWKAKEEFFKRQKSIDGLGHKCKSCALRYEANRRKAKSGVS